MNRARASVARLQSQICQPNGSQRPATPDHEVGKPKLAYPFYDGIGVTKHILATALRLRAGKVKGGRAFWLLAGSLIADP